MLSRMLHYFSVQWAGYLLMVYLLMSRQHSPSAQSTEEHLLLGHHNSRFVLSGPVQMNLQGME